MMGKRLVDYYERAKELGGIPAKIRLIALTKMTTAQAEEAPDTSELIQSFSSALNTIKEEYKNKKTDPASPVLKSSNNRSKQFDDTYLYLRKQIPQLRQNPEQALKKITESVADTLNVERSGIWLLKERQTMIECVDLYSRKTRGHTCGMRLMAKDFPVYFRALLYERTIAADDANADPRTSAFSEPYLKPLGITSMLDVPIWSKGKMLGILCNEHTVTRRKWEAEEEHFAYNMASMVALCIQGADK